MRKHCDFPGCTGGCHWCTEVNNQRATRAVFEAALRLADSGSVSADVKAVASFVLDETTPRINERKKRWYDDWERRALRAGVMRPGWAT